MIKILLQLREELVVQDYGPRRIWFRGFRVVDQVVDCTVDIHAGGTGASGYFYSKKLIPSETIGKVVWVQGLFIKLRVILVEN
jgi:hypothetical protein